MGVFPQFSQLTWSDSDLMCIMSFDLRWVVDIFCLGENFHMFHSWYFQWYFFHVQCLCNISCFCSNFEFIFCYFRYILFVWVIPHISQVYYHLCFSTFTVWATYQVEFWNNTGMCSVYIITMFTLKHHIWNPDSICF